MSIDWESIFTLDFTYEPGCWKTCNGHCCKFDSPKLKFQFLSSGAGMVFFDQEFEFLKQTNRLQSGFIEKVKEWKFDLAPDLQIRFFTSTCSLGGLCSLPQYRPLCCKLYPFFPCVDLENSQITAALPGGGIDQLWGLFGEPHPCTLLPSQDALLAKAKASLDLLLRHPYFLFYFKIAELFIRELQNSTALLKSKKYGTDLKTFSQIWEMQYLTGRLVRLQGLRLQIEQTYRKLQERFPKFTLSAH